ncbi:DUF924 family protein [Thalassobius sp. Cn5-15]|uniref:DUF924 family protein n=1 Tax=Thalassobius sp. Cn5-15 TaxID=2917763 RepID=UPI001EF2A1BE|nr:DUF924 family protein [Thalassobius sp. Cn5-15]MCG7492141.1 DUF924 domain-containing protein [Thalassobius sp. Cn5-15]
MAGTMTKTKKQTSLNIKCTPEEVLTFWLDEVGEKSWYLSDAELDAKITARFGEAWQAARAGRFGMWLTYPSGALAYIILLDQFPRNMFRGSGQAFATDAKALAAAKIAIDHHWDMKIDAPARQFFYLPLMHSENLCDQERCVRMMKERMPQQGGSNLLHAKAHRKVIRDFGRFPYRNAALGRHNTPHERAFLAESGYGDVVRELQGAAAAAV